MVRLLGLILVSFFLTSFLLVPFIDLLFFLKKRSNKSNNSVSDTKTPIHNTLLAGKDLNTPVGGGLLVIPVVLILTFAAFYFFHLPVTNQTYIIIFTLLSFGLIGFMDDIRKIFISFSGKYAGIRSRYILLLQIIFGLISAFMIYNFSGYNNLYIPLVGNFVIGWVYIPIAAFAIVSFANACNFSDGMDGLSCGLLVICLFAFLILAQSVFNENLSVFVGAWIGCLIAYLYFNVYPARIYLGDAGAYGFGATLAVIGLLTGKILGLAVIGGVFLIIAASSLIQILSKRILKRKLFPVAPIHMYFKYLGWEEPKIVLRFWLAGAMFAIFGLWMALLSK